MKVEVTGIVDDDRIARLNQEPADQIDRLGAGFRQDDVIRGGRDAAFVHPPGQQLPQWKLAERRSVIGKNGILSAGNGPQRLSHRIDGHPAFRQPAASGLQQGRAVFQRLPVDPERIDRPVEFRPDIGQRQRCWWAGRVKARSRA